MTSELEKLIAEGYGDRCPEYDADCPCCQIWSEYDTRAVPDVPELVRYRIWFDNNYNEIVDEEVDGEYVRYKQAAAVIAAKDGRITDYKNLVDALHAKLAQYEAQEPICWIPTATAKWLNEYDGSACAVQTAVHNKPIKSDGGVKLYASPAPPADLREENERLREALTKIASFSQTAGLLWWQVEARAALNVEASHDKG